DFRTCVRDTTSMKRTRVRWGRVAVLATAMAVPVGVHAAGASDGHRAASSRTYVVRAGDTLWSIASRIAGPGADPRPVVDALQRANHVTGAIVPGETLRLP